MISTMDGVTLPPDLEQFATEAVAAGRYRDTAEVVRAGVSSCSVPKPRWQSSWPRSRQPGTRPTGMAGSVLTRCSPKWTRSYARRQTARLESDGAFLAAGSARNRPGAAQHGPCRCPAGSALSHWKPPHAGWESIRNTAALRRRMSPSHTASGLLPRFGYVLVYDPQTEPIEILRFVHTSRDLPQALAELRRSAGDADPV